MRVLQIIHGLGMGGAETWLMEVLRRWVACGSGRMDFLLTGGRPEIFDDEARALGAKLHYLRYGRANLFSFIREYRALLRRESYDAIHDHADYAAGWRLAMAADVMPPVRVVHVHNPWLHISANYAVSPSRRLATVGGKALVNAFASHVCGTSAEILRRYGFEPSKSGRPLVSVAHCGFDVTRFNGSHETDRSSVRREFGWPEEARLVLFAGRLDRAIQLDHPQNHKNSWFALNVARAAYEKDRRIRLVMAGEGDSRRELQNRIAAWGLNDQLRLAGIRKNIARLMRAADVLLFPSRQEGLGMVAVEAQAAGVPVLASTAVPRECVVIPELYTALPLTEQVTVWADTLIRVMAAPRPAMDTCRIALEASAYSIRNSALALEQIYRAGQS